MSATGDGSQCIGTYHLPAPGGSWDLADNGVYGVAVAGGSVANVSGVPILAAQLGTFTVAVPLAVLDVNGALRVNGTAGNDTIVLSGSGGILTVSENGDSLFFDLAAVHTISAAGGPGADVIRLVEITIGALLRGNGGDDTITGGVGPDTINGGVANDSLVGGQGGDVILGGAGNDTMIGGKGRDLLYGQSGNDLLRGGLGFDCLWAGPGDDLLYARDSAVDALDGGDGWDRGDSDAGLDQLLGVEASLI